MKVANITSNIASISAHKEMLIICLREIFSTLRDPQSQGMMQYIQALEEKKLSKINENNIEDVIINPVLRIALRLGAVLVLPDDETKALIDSKKDMFKKSLVHLIELSSMIKDQRVTNAAFETADEFIEYRKNNLTSST